MKCPYCAVDAIQDNRKCTNCGYDILLKSRDPMKDNIERVRSYGLFGPMIADMMEAQARERGMYESKSSMASKYDTGTQKNSSSKYSDLNEYSETSKYKTNVESVTRQKTADLYKWEGQALETAQRTGKQLQIPLRQTLHLDIPGMETFMAAGIAAMCLPIVAKAPEMLIKKKLEEKPE